MTLPNFFILGTAKAGTTSLASYLRQHPQIYIPQNKEPNFFILEGCDLPPFSGPANAKRLYETIYKCSVTDLESYQSLFDGVKNESAIGDATVLYLYFPEAADRIQQRVPNARMIVILRNPIDRLYSHYLMVRKQYFLEPLNLVQALEQEEIRIHQNWGWDWHYARVSQYYYQLKYYFEKFDSTQFKIFLYEDYCSDPIKVIQEIFQHIGVDETFLPDLSQRSKVAPNPRNLALGRLLNQPNHVRAGIKQILPNMIFNKVITLGNKLNQKSFEPIEPALRCHLQNKFRPDILKLQNLIQRDLSSWLEPA